MDKVKDVFIIKKTRQEEKICIMKMLKVLVDYWLKPRPRPFEEK
jgi:hypothetical protein